MPLPDLTNRQPVESSELTEDLAQLAARLGSEVVQFANLAEVEAGQVVIAHCQERHQFTLSASIAHWLSEAVARIKLDSAAQAVPIDGGRTLVLAGLNTQLYRARVASLIEAPATAARALMQAACEATVLDRKAKGLQLQLDISAQQIAQSFEEQCWLRDLARNMSISPETANANLLAQGILKPLLDLLRSEELFLLVREEETARSGLTSTYFGADKILLTEIAGLMQSLVQTKPTGAIVLNNARLLNGRIHSLVAVPLLSCERPLGYIVAVNRLPHTSSSFHLMSADFGSLEVVCWKKPVCC